MSVHTPTFEERYRELEEIIRRLESGDSGLDESLSLYENGVAALRECHKVLAEAERKIEILVKTSDGTMAPQPFKTSAEDSPE